MILNHFDAVVDIGTVYKKASLSHRVFFEGQLFDFDGFWVTMVPVLLLPWRNKDCQVLAKVMKYSSYVLLTHISKSNFNPPNAL